METTLQVSGMSCQHCKSAVEKALNKIEGVSKVDVDLDHGKVKVEHLDSVKEQTLKEAIEDQGYDVQ